MRGIYHKAGDMPGGFSGRKRSRVDPVYAHSLYLPYVMYYLKLQDLPEKVFKVRPYGPLLEDKHCYFCSAQRVVRPTNIIIILILIINLYASDMLILTLLIIIYSIIRCVVWNG